MNSIEKSKYADNWFRADKEFNHLFPSSIRALAQKHWSPLVVARKASGFLANGDKVRILDVGSGIGKFCLVAAYYNTNVTVYGIEQRKDLVSHAETAKQVLNLNNVFFIHGNFTQLDFRNYDHFYFYNSFYENLDSSNKIDDSIEYSTELYNYYNRYLCMQLDQKPAGTRVATFHCLQNEVLQSYTLVDSEFENQLLYYIKR